jgi:hypothetical protein
MIRDTYYTVTIEYKDGEKWNELAQEVEFFITDNQGGIALRNPFGDDEVLHPQFESIVDIEEGVVDNGHSWFFAGNSQDPPSASDGLPEEEQWTAPPFR